MTRLLRFRVFSRLLRGGYNYDSTSIRRPFDGHSTAYQRSLRSQWCNPLAAVTLTCLFIMPPPLG